MADEICCSGAEKERLSQSNASILTEMILLETSNYDATKTTKANVTTIPVGVSLKSSINRKIFTTNGEMDRTISTVSLLESLVEYSGPTSDRISKTESVLKQICRTCLTEIPDQSLANNIFLADATNPVTIRDKLLILTGMKISSGDKMPHNICHGCLRLIEAAFSFRVHTQRVDDILKRFLRKIYSSKDEVPATEREPIPPSVSANSGKIDETNAAIQVEGYQVSFVKDADASFQCIHCNMEFTNQLDMEKHTAEHGPSVIRKKLFKCGMCSKEYSFRNGLHNHLLTAHVQKKEYQCPVCGKMFKKRDRFLAHKKTFCIAPDAIITAPKGASEITIYPIGEWMTAENIHVEIRNFSCSLCDGKYEFEADFINHLQEHSAMKKCCYCKKNFNRAADLESHIRSHTNEKPFVCPLCSKGFIATRSFRNHLSLHTKREPYACDMCGKKFLSERELVKHRNSHKQEPVSVDLEEYEEAIKMSLNSKKQEKSANTFDLNPVSAIDLPKSSALGNEWVIPDTDRNAVIEPEVLDENFSGSTTVSCSTSAQSDRTMEADIAMDFRSSEGAIVIKKENIEAPSTSHNEQVQPISDQTIWNEPPIGFDIIVKEENLSGNHSAFEITNEPLTDDEAAFAPSKQGSTPQTDCNELPFGFEIIDNPEKSDNAHSPFTTTNETSFIRSKQDSAPPQNCIKLPYGFEFIDNPQKLDAGHSTSKASSDPLVFPGEFDKSKQELAEQSYTSFTCVVAECKMEFKYYRDIINHYTSQHCIGPPPFKCPVCTAMFPIKLNVRTHLKMHLTCEYKCPHCPRAYWQLRDLKIHLRTHTGERPFKCTKCPKRFKQRAALKVHIKTHSICKEYKCTVCAKEFFSYNGLFLHQKCHSEIKELQCTFCHKQFPTKSRLQRHQNGVCGSRTMAVKA